MIKLIRVYRELSTLSKCYYQDQEICLVLERPWKDNENDISCIPEGVYILDRHNSVNRGETFALVNHGLDVGHWPGEAKRFTCLIHPVTHVSGLKGCLGPGLTEFDPDSVGYSSDATKKLLGLIMSEGIKQIKISS